jgi:hypothetical protein
MSRRCWSGSLTGSDGGNRSEDLFHEGGDLFHEGGDLFHEGGDLFHEGGDLFHEVWRLVPRGLSR